MVCRTKTKKQAYKSGMITVNMYIKKYEKKKYSNICPFQKLTQEHGQQLAHVTFSKASVIQTSPLLKF